MTTEKKSASPTQKTSEKDIQKEAQQAVVEYMNSRTLALQFSTSTLNIRTGFYATMKGAYFIISAGHLLTDELVKDMIAISRCRQTLENDPYPKLRPWEKDKFPGDRLPVKLLDYRLVPENPIDLFVARVEPLPSCDGWLHAFDLENEVVDSPDVRSLAVLVGYPVDRAKFRGTLDRSFIQGRLSIRFHASKIAEPSGSLSGYDEAHHFLLNYNPKNNDEPQGMSGGAICTVPMKDIPIWNPTIIKLAGVQSSHYAQSHILKAVRVQEAVKLAKELV